MVEAVPAPLTRAQIVERAATVLTELTELLDQGERNTTCVVAVHTRVTRPSPSSIRKLEMDAALASRMKRIVLERIGPARQWVRDGHLQAYDQRGLQEHDVRCVVSVDIPVVDQWLTALPPSDGWARFRRREWSAKQISGLFFKLDIPGTRDPLIAFTKWSDSLLLQRKGILAAVSNNHYQLQELDDQIYLPETIHFFSFRGVVFALNWEQFAAAVRFKELTEQRANEMWSAFVGDVPVVGSDAVWSIVSKSVRNQNSVIKAMTRPGRSVPSLDRIQRHIDEERMSIRIENGQLVVDVNDKSQVEDLITIMADGFVTSDITDTKLRTLDAEPRNR